MPQVFDCDAVLFDLDGVLADSSAVVRRHWTRWARQHGFEPDHVVHTAHGRRPRDTIALLRPDVEDPDAEADELLEDEIGDFEGLKVLPGGKELIAQLPTGHWTVATSGPRRIATERLQFAGIPIPPTMVTGEDVPRGKPDPAPYALAAERLGIPAERCVVIEDAVAGVKSAKAAGARVIGVLTTHSREQLAEAGADCVVEGLPSLRLESGSQAIRIHAG